MRLGTVELVMETQISAALFDSASGAGGKKVALLTLQLIFGGVRAFLYAQSRISYQLKGD